MTDAIDRQLNSSLCGVLAAAPEVMYKYTDSRGVRSMAEGIVKFGDFDDYRKAEDNTGDQNENSFISKRVRGWDLATGNPVSFQLQLNLPGVMFCASINGNAYGVFGYPYRIAIKTKSFLLAIRRAIYAGDYFSVDRQGNRVPLKFWEVIAGTNRWQKTRNPNVRVGLVAMKVEYRDVSTGIHPGDIIKAKYSCNPMRAFANMLDNVPQVDMFVKGKRFSREEEYRLVLSFSPPDQKLVSMTDGRIMYKEYDCRSSIFVRIRNPRRVFSLPF